MARPIVICKECGEEKEHWAHGLCRRCCDRRYRGKRAEYQRQWYAGHREQQAERNLRWQRANPDKVLAQRRRHRARKKGAAIDPIDYAVIYELYDNACIYCGATRRLEIDHVVPLAGGGSHREDNLVVACKRCNSSKGARLLMKWLETQPYSQAWVM